MRRLGAFIVVALMTVPIVTAHANHRTPPRARLRSQDTVQRGKLGTYCWAWQEGGSGTGTCVDALPTWPDGKQADRAARARIRIMAPGCPTDMSLRWWSDVEKGDGDVAYPEGEGKSIDFTKEEVTEGDDVVACRVRFRLPDHAGHFYMQMSTFWQGLQYDDGGSAEGDAQHQYHLRLS